MSGRPAKKHPKKGHVLVLRTCEKDGTSYEGFQWPRKGKVEAPDWDPRPECGRGLHGWLRGEGDGGLIIGGEDRLWLVVSVKEADIVDLRGKVKFPQGEVIFCSDRVKATAIIQAAYPDAVVIGGTATAGYKGTATAGVGGTLVLSYWDLRRRVVVGYVGEGGIEANTPYRLDAEHKFVEANPGKT